MLNYLDYKHSVLDIKNMIRVKDNSIIAYYDLLKKFELILNEEYELSYVEDSSVADLVIRERIYVEHEIINCYNYITIEYNDDTKYLKKFKEPYNAISEIRNRIVDKFAKIENEKQKEIIKCAACYKRQERQDFNYLSLLNYINPMKLIL